METKTANLDDAREFAEAIHAEFPDKMLAYNLSPSFNWGTIRISSSVPTTPAPTSSSSASSSAAA